MARLQRSLERAHESGAPKVVVNCSFGNCMDEKEITSVATQAQLCYNHIRDLESPMQLHLTSLTEDNPSMPAFQAIGYAGWLVHAHQETVWDLFDSDRLVILTPD